MLSKISDIEQTMSSKIYEAEEDMSTKMSPLEESITNIRHKYLYISQTIYESIATLVEQTVPCVERQKKHRK